MRSLTAQVKEKSNVVFVVPPSRAECAGVERRADAMPYYATGRLEPHQE